MSGLAPQRRNRRVAMTHQERDAHLQTERTCRVATVGADGTPHVAPLWFLWHDSCLWLWSITGSQRWTNLERDPRVSIVVDTGETYGELRGVEMTGRAEVVGDVPRTSEPDPVLEEVERGYARKNHDDDTFVPDGRHAWLRVTPTKIVSWDFRKR